MERKGLIYIAKDSILNKCYIGQTLTTLENRKNQHLKHAKNKLDQTYFTMFYKMIRILGEDKFTWSILEDNISSKELNEKEIYYISKYNSYEDGYNSGPGGQASHNSLLSKEEVDLIVDLLKNDNLTMTQIAKKVSRLCTRDMISDINCGETWYNSNINYPIRSIGFNKKINFNKEQILEITDLLKTNISLKEISEKFNCHPITISKINEGISYRLDNLSYPIRNKKFTKTSDEQLEEIIKLLKSKKYKIIEIAKKLDIDRKIVSNINNGKYIDKNRIYSIDNNIKFPINKN